MKLQEHQYEILNYFLQNKTQRGMLLLHGTGSGKTITSITISEKFKSFKETLIIAPKSLHDNFRKELKKFDIKEDDDRYKFISSNASNMIDKLTSKEDISGVTIKNLNLDNKFIIIDEAHNLLVSMFNGSKNATQLYTMLMNAKNCKILFLTASGIINNIYEIIICLNICKGYIFSDNQKYTLYPESYLDFVKYFIDQKLLVLKNVNKLRNRMFGLVSYKGDLFEHEVNSFYKDIKRTIKKENYPDRKPIKIELIPMSNQQLSEYEISREKERLETKAAIGGALIRETIFNRSTSYRIKSRQISNIYYPPLGTVLYKSEKIDQPSDKDKIPIIEDLSTDKKEDEIESDNIEKKEIESDNIEKEEIESDNKNEIEGGKIKINKKEKKIPTDEDERFTNEEYIKRINENIEIYSPKLNKLFKTINPDYKCIVYSAFIRYGIQAIGNYLKYKGYREYIVGKDINPEYKYYGVYTGSIPPENRTIILNEYNKIDSPLKILLISSSGAEGLSCKHTRQVFIMEPYWNLERIFQTMARGIRFHSHSDMDVKDRNVQVYIFLSVYPKDYKSHTEQPISKVVNKDTNITELPTDVYLFKESVNKYELNHEMIKILASVSIECDKFNKVKNIDCYKCETTKPLYIADIDKDMSYPSPCVIKKNISVEEILINGIYYYLDTDKNIYIKNADNEYIKVIDKDVISYIKNNIKLNI